LGAGDSDGLLLAPCSIAFCLALALDGAAGRTRAELAGALGVPGLAEADVDDRFRDLRRQLEQSGPGVELAVANAVWAPAGTALDAGFLRRAQEFHAAGARTLDLGGPAAAEAVNRWASDRTRGRITRLVGPDDLRAGPGCVLTNATYFTGRWRTPFDPALTRPGPFTSPDGRRTDVPMMTRSGRFAHQSTADFQAVDLDYAGGDLGMVVVLPREGSAPALPPGRAWPTRFEPAPLTLSLPRFSVTSELDLVPPLAALGLAGIFRPGADFSRMGAAGSFVSAFRHTARMDVGEEGTEAAAGTAVVLGRSRLPSRTMVVDRPFAVAVVHRRSGLVLFLGRVTRPQPLPADHPG
jgi:serpin B